MPLPYQNIIMTTFIAQETPPARTGERGFGSPPGSLQRCAPSRTGDQRPRLLTRHPKGTSWCAEGPRRQASQAYPLPFRSVTFDSGSPSTLRATLLPIKRRGSDHVNPPEIE
ncbi:hypothetical protein GTS_50420 [Gandjariella thermophila]|uniref:Uncharacterized protein n=1 Tax=Gandjariella thermophila TaxID=1931992 RepID=A0A4D4JGG4_9PSEU|nr:hypothetical protein GTS_50420 [Gandjariella thermophila]